MPGAVGVDDGAELPVSIASGSADAAVLGDGALRQASNAGAKAMFLEVGKDNAPALALYERLGFGKVGERAGYYRRKDGTRAAAVIMRKAIG